MKEGPLPVTEQAAIINALGVAPDFDAAQEARRRIYFLATYLRTSGLSSYILGISGGVDSLAAALLAQRAVEELRSTGYEARFLAVRLFLGLASTPSSARARTPQDRIGHPLFRYALDVMAGSGPASTRRPLGGELSQWKAESQREAVVGPLARYSAVETR